MLMNTFAVFASLVTAGSASADIRDVALVGNSTLTAVWTPQGWDVDLRVFNLSGSGATVFVESFNTTTGIPESDPIASFDIQVDTTQATVIIQRAAGVPVGQTVPYIRSLDKSGAGTLILTIRNIDGDLGLSTSSPNDTFMPDIFGNIEVGGSVYADLLPQSTSQGNVGRVTIDGDLNGSIITPATGGVISGPITIGGAQTNGIIETNAINGDVSITGNTRRIRVRDAVLNGDLAVGSLNHTPGLGFPLSLHSLAGNLTCDGNVEQQIVLGRDWDHATDDLICSIGGTLKANNAGQDDRMLFIIDQAVFGGTTDTTPLEHQIIINADNNGGRWDGDVALNWSEGVDQNGNPITINEIRIGEGQSQPYEAPYYHALPAELGGGAIGLVPFNFHPKASLPENATVWEVRGPRVQAIAEHYGPVYAPTSGVAPVVIELADATGDLSLESTWSNDVTTDFTFTISNDANTLDRTLKIRPKSGEKWIDGRHYRIRPTSDANALACGSVAGNPDAVYVADPFSAGDARNDHWYFEIDYLIMPFDLNQNLAVDAPDAALWLDEPVDFNDDGNADATDFQLLLNNMD